MKYTVVSPLLLKGQCHEIFDNFFGLKDSNYAPYDEQAKTISQTF